MAVLQPSVVLSSNEFDYDGKTRQLTAEISTLSRGSRRVFIRVYDDACDEGIAIRSERTGKTKFFVMNRTDYDGGDDVVAWHFVPVDEVMSIIYQDAEPSCSVLVFND